MKAALIPHECGAEEASYVKHTDSWRFLFKDSVISLAGVEDVKLKLQHRRRGSERRASSATFPYALRLGRAMGAGGGGRATICEVGAFCPPFVERPSVSLGTRLL